MCASWLFACWQIACMLTAHQNEGHCSLSICKLTGHRLGGQCNVTWLANLHCLYLTLVTLKLVLHGLIAHSVFTQAIIRAVCAIIDAFHSAVPVVGDRLEPEEAAMADGDAADGGNDGACPTTRSRPGEANNYISACSNI